MTLPMSPMVRLALPGKRVCFWGAPADLPPEDGRPSHWRSLLEQTGGNTGNLFIGHGLSHNLDAAHKSYHPGFGVLPASRFDEEFDCLIIPASNFINPALDLQGMYDYFSCTKAPIYCFGLGSQVVPGKPVILKRGTEAFIRLIAERSATIGVRGAFTADLLWSMGIRNISLTGCPSLMGLDDETIKSLVSKRPSMGKLATNYSNNVRNHSFDPEAIRVTENALFRHLMDQNSFYILQNEAPELALLDSMRSGESRAMQEILPTLSNTFDIAPINETFRTYFQTRLRVFYSVPSWIGSMRTMTATVGTRFHGNIASILGGTPGMVLIHDMRTLELAELFGIPHVILDRAYAAEDIVERLMNVDYAPFARRIGLLRCEWRAFAARNGLDAF